MRCDGVTHSALARAASFKPGDCGDYRLLPSAGFASEMFSFISSELPRQLRGVHRRGPGRQGAELAGDFGPHAVADAVLAAGQAAHEEADALSRNSMYAPSSLPL